MKKILATVLACIVLAGCIAVAGCVTGNHGPETSGDAVWVSAEHDDGVTETRTMTFHTDGTGEKLTSEGPYEKSQRTFTWIQPDNRHFICTFPDGDVDTFTVTADGRLTHDGRYYSCRQQGSLPAVTTPPADPKDHPEILGTWETYELKKKGVDTKTLEFRADGTGTKTKIKAKGTVEETPFTWAPVGSCYVLYYSDGLTEDDDTVQIVDGRLDHDGEVFVKT